MTINEQQFHYLATMGISVWQSRDGIYPSQVKTDHSANQDGNNDVNHDVKIKAKTVESEASVNIAAAKVSGYDKTNLLADGLFQDVLIALGVSVTDVNFNHDKITINTLEWQFNDQPCCQLNEQVLSTPNLEKIAQNSELKRQLWTLLCQHLAAIESENPATDNAVH